MKNITYIALILGLSFCISCDFKTGVTGEGTVDEKTIELGKDFKSLSLANGWKVILKKADKNAIKIVANQNLIDLLTYKLEESSLKIAAKNNIGNADSKEITIFHSKKLGKIETGSGIKLSFDPSSINDTKLTLSLASGSLTKAQIKTDSLNLGLSSGANANLNGSATFINCIASSGSNVNAKKLNTKTAIIEASSGANIRIQVNNSLEAKASSGGNITYTGTPKKLNKDTSSGGNITAAN
ncbi:head GIN domain-containing protein [uncultured Mesonia sp.]|uniref:head GIN domain-containing protein n=1 Tax=uncultured Mesonia sp. TaxID=399731 RepID=UPI00374E8A1B